MLAALKVLWLLSQVALARVAIVKLLRMKRAKLGSTSMIFRKRLVLWFHSQVVLPALRRLGMLSQVALAIWLSNGSLPSRD